MLNDFQEWDENDYDIAGICCNCGEEIIGTGMTPYYEINNDKWCDGCMAENQYYT